MENLKIGFIGAGNMGSAIMKGIISSLGEKAQLSAFDPDSAKLAELGKLSIKACADECVIK